MQCGYMEASMKLMSFALTPSTYLAVRKFRFVLVIKPKLIFPTGRVGMILTIMLQSGSDRYQTTKPSDVPTIIPTTITHT